LNNHIYNNELHTHSDVSIITLSSCEFTQY